MVLGVSVHMDVMERLEKRVKSRFSHKRIMVWEPRFFNLVRGDEGTLSGVCVWRGGGSSHTTLLLPGEGG